MSRAIGHHRVMRFRPDPRGDASRRESASPGAGSGSELACFARRDLLAGVPGVVLAITAAGGVSGCGLRLERGAPQLPIVPTARGYPGAAALRAELARCASARNLAQAWSGAGGPVLSRVLVRVHGEHVEALRARLESVSEATQAPESGEASADATSGRPNTTEPTGGPDAEQTAPETATPEAAARRGLLVAETAALSDTDDLAAAPPADRSLLGGCRVTRAQAARLLGAPALPTPHRPVAGSVEHAVELLETVRPVLYGLEVATARVVVAGDERATLARQSLEAVRRQRQHLEQQAGSAAPAPPPGYALDAPVTTPAQAAMLARRLLTALADAHVSALGSIPGQAGQPTARESDSPPQASPRAVAALMGWAREAEWWRSAWGPGPRAVGLG